MNLRFAVRHGNGSFCGQCAVAVAMAPPANSNININSNINSNNGWVLFSFSAVRSFLFPETVY